MVQRRSQSEDSTLTFGVEIHAIINIVVTWGEGEERAIRSFNFVAVDLLHFACARPHLTFQGL